MEKTDPPQPKNMMSQRQESGASDSAGVDVSPVRYFMDSIHDPPYRDRSMVFVDSIFIGSTKELAKSLGCWPK